MKAIVVFVSVVLLVSGCKSEVAVTGFAKDPRFFALLKHSTESSQYILEASEDLTDDSADYGASLKLYVLKAGEAILSDKKKVGLKWESFSQAGDEGEFFVCGTIATSSNKFDVLMISDGKFVSVFDGGSDGMIEIGKSENGRYRIVTRIDDAFTKGERNFFWDGNRFSETRGSKAQQW